MLIAPTNEQSTIILFASDAVAKLTKLTYIGPIITSDGKITTNPDAIVISKKTNKYRMLKAEFKYIVTGLRDFEHNGMFDIAIVWAISSTINKTKLRQKLKSRNGCRRLIELSEFEELNSLPKIKSIKEYKSIQLKKIDEMKKLILKKDKYIAYLSIIAAKIYPKNFNIKNMITVLVNEFPKVYKTMPRGRAGIVTALLQTHPQLIKHMYKHYYKWNDELDPELATIELTELLTNNFEIDMPKKSILNYVTKENVKPPKKVNNS